MSLEELSKLTITEELRGEIAENRRRHLKDIRTLKNRYAIPGCNHDTFRTETP